MIARDGDDDSMRDARGRGRNRRDVLDIGDGRQDRGGRHPRDLDDDDYRERRRGRDEDRDTRPRDRVEDRGDTRPRDRDDDRDRRRHTRDDDRDRPDDDEDDRQDDRQDDRRDEKKNGGGAKGADAKNGKDDKKNGKDDKKSDGKTEDEEAQGRRRKRRPVVIIVALVVAALLIAGGIYFYLSTRGKASTDDAYTDGNVVAIAPQISGQVISLEVNDNQFVHKGDVLVRVDPRQFTYTKEQAQGTLDSFRAQQASQKLGVDISKKNFPAALQLAQANLASAKANLLLQQANYERQKNLPKAATTQQDVDTASANFQQAQAQVEQNQARVIQAEPVQQNIGQSQEQVSQINGQAEQAQGQLDQANLNIEWAVVRAPQDGWVTRRNVNAGNYVAAGTQIMSLVTTDVWITANFKETELDGMRPGQGVKIKVDAYPDLDLRGHVDSIQRGSGSKFSAFPAENATGNFVKIVQRVPVKLVIDSGLKPDEPLPLGISVEPTVMLK